MSGKEVGELGRLSSGYLLDLRCRPVLRTMGDRVVHERKFTCIVFRNPKPGVAASKLLDRQSAVPNGTLGHGAEPSRYFVVGESFGTGQNSFC